MVDLITTLVPVADVRNRLLVTVLPAEAHALLAAGQHVSHVGALYAPDADTAERLLAGQLRARTGFDVNMTPNGFLRYASRVWDGLGLSRFGLFQAFARTAYLCGHFESDRYAMGAVIGTHYVAEYDDVYENFMRAINVLGWLVSTSFTTELSQEQVDMLAALTAFWFTIVDPEREG